MSGRKKFTPPFETEIESLGPKGVGVGTAPNGQPVYVRAAPPGSRVLVRPSGRKKGIWKGTRTAMVRPAPDHLSPPCPVFGLCGGCVLQEIPLDRQRALKLERARDEVGPTPWEPILGADDAYGYRNKMEFSFGTARYLSEADHAEGTPIDGRFLGMHAPGRFDRVVDTHPCALIDEAMNAVLLAVRQATLHDQAPPPWNPRAHTGFFRHLQLRQGADGLFVALFTAPGSSDEEQFVRELFASLLAQPLGIVGAQWLVNDKVADVAQGDVTAHWGAESVRMQLDDTSFVLAPDAFFQTNTAGAEVLYRTIGDALGRGHRRLLDLYCGTGSIGIFLADHAEEVVGIEVIPSAIDNARHNAAANGVQARYVVAKVEDVLDELAGGDGVAAIVDPPRVGLHPKVAQVLATAPLSVLIYVACNAASLGRDRLVLEAGGWVLERCWAVDLFPQTGHLEVVGRFVRP